MSMNTRLMPFSSKYYWKYQLVAMNSRKFSIDEDISEFVELPPEENQVKDKEVPPYIMRRMKSNGEMVWKLMEFAMYKEALEYLDKVKADLDCYFSKEHTGYLIYENNLGVLYRLSENYKESLEILSKTFERHIKKFGETDSYTLNWQENLANTLRDMGEYDKAIKYYEDVIAIRKKNTGDPESYAVALGLCGEAYRLKGDLKTANTYFNEAYAIQASFNQSEDCVPCANLLTSMGKIYLQQQNLPKAVDYFDRSLQIKEKALGSSHPEVIEVKQNLAQSYNIWGKPGRALDILTECEKQIEEFQDERERFNRR